MADESWGYALLCRVLKVYLKSIYIKLVVIVNASIFVGKSLFVNEISDLGHQKVAGKALYHGSMLTV
jgi:hypothetical protein